MTIGQLGAWFAQGFCYWLGGALAVLLVIVLAIALGIPVLL